jgi:hypothetical protein
MLKSLAGQWEGNGEGLKPMLDIEENSDGSSILEQFELVVGGTPTKKRLCIQGCSKSATM